jgi:small GTP-binding protein
MNKNFLQRSIIEDNNSFYRHSMQTEIRHFYKVILLGSVAVGKTSVLRQFLENKFECEYSCTIGVDFKNKSILIDHNTWVEMSIWDTCGQEKFRNLTKQFYNNAKGNTP